MLGGSEPALLVKDLLERAQQPLFSLPLPHPSLTLTIKLL